MKHEGSTANAKIQSVKCKIPQTVDAVDGTHIEINSLWGDSKVDCSNKKLKYSINTQAVVGANLEFIDITADYLESTHNAHSLRDSSMYFQVESNNLLNESTDIID